MRQIIPFSKDIVFKTNIASITSISLEHEEKITDGEISGNFIILGDYKIHNDTTEKELFKYRLPYTALIPDDIDESSVYVDIDNFTYEQIENDVLKVNIDFSVAGEEKEERIEILEEHDNVDEVFQEVPDNIDEIYEAIDNFVEMRNKEESSSTEEVVEEIKEERDMVKEDDRSENLDSVEEITSFNMDNIEISDNEEKIVEERDDDEQLLYIQEQIDKVKKMEQKSEIDVKVDEEKEIASVEQKEKVEHSEYVTYHIHIVGSDETLDSIFKKYGSTMEVVKEYNDLSNIKIGDKVIIPEYLDE